MLISTIEREISKRKHEMRSLQQEIVFELWPKKQWSAAEDAASQITNLAFEIDALELRLREAA